MNCKYTYIEKSDARYPEKLKNYERMPLSLYFKGTLPDPSRKSVAIVGARSCSRYGLQTALLFAKELAANGVQIISGLALGIDSAAHEGALRGGGQTFAVLGSGIDNIYPASNKGLCAHMIENGGGIISEFEPDSPPSPFHFPVRNRIISALSDAVLVVEAKRRSGSLITASYALEQGVQIYAVPGRISDALSLGTNELIAQGAIPATSPSQLLDDLGIQSPITNVPPQTKSAKSKIKKEEDFPSCKSYDKPAVPTISADERLLLSFLSCDTLSVDELCELSGFDVSRVSQILLSLELSGAVCSLFPGSYAAVYK